METEEEVSNIAKLQRKMELVFDRLYIIEKELDAIQRDLDSLESRVDSKEHAIIMVTEN